MEQAPAWFVERLRREFDGRFRIRWSVKSKDWQIEQKFGRALTPPIRVEASDDELIRAIDGYELAFTLRPGDRRPCLNPSCMATVKVPHLKFAEVRCPNCNQLHPPTGYFPLNESVLEWLRRIDPMNGGTERVIASINDKMDRRERDRERTMANIIEASTKENWNAIAGILSKGYTGKERMWDR